MSTSEYKSGLLDGYRGAANVLDRAMAWSRDAKEIRLVSALATLLRLEGEKAAR
jgi:hypothetical protein